MNKYIVITSIYPPTEAVIEFSKINDYQLIVVGDKKTPVDWSYKNVNYLSIAAQETGPFKLANFLPYNHYCRKMIGYLTAIKSGAELIVDTDDDNIPKINWSIPDFNHKYDSIEENLGFINIYELFTDQNIWPRGLPLHLINKKFQLESYLSHKDCMVGIWQGLADEDPDVDAIYRLTSNKLCYFKERNPVVLGKNTISPFNTQNTFIRKELFALLYLPTYVTFRFTDILRGLIAQPIMWQYGFQLGFTSASVIQKRNQHNLMKDFESEIPMYLFSEKIVDIVSDSILKSESIEVNLYNAYKALFSEKIVCDKEMKTLEYWLSDLNKLL